VVLIHGFTQSGAAWGTITDRVAAAGHQTIAVDAPGHGGSATVEADLPAGADLMVGVAADAGPAAWLGYSMGGRFALHAALRHPEAMSRLVLVSTSAGIDDPDERAARRASDEALAERVETEGVEAFVDWWLTIPLFATLPPEAARRPDRLSNTAAGLASSLRLAGAGTQEPLWDRLAAIEMPVLVVAGEMDRAYAERAHRLADSIGPNATARIIPGAGHACHLEQPEAFLETVLPWLDPADPPDHTGPPEQPPAH
jgi:2-succinyl-6-hydroxy-2,4-cyclohexadiene-1-carboxylate synthase